MRAQFSLEFLAMFSIALIFLIVFAGFAFNERANESDLESLAQARGTTELFASMVNDAAQNSGYYAAFYPPALLAGRNYSLKAAPNYVYAEWEGGRFFSSEVRAASLNCSACPFSPPGKLVVRNSGGQVVVEKTQ